jgi:hypothetical protein
MTATTATGIRGISLVWMRDPSDHTLMVVEQP